MGRKSDRFQNFSVCRLRLSPRHRALFKSRVQKNVRLTKGSAWQLVTMWKPICRWPSMIPLQTAYQPEPDYDQ
jgi:hypothetical protein